MNLSVYSTTLTPRNARPKIIVATSQNTCVFGFALVCAERTAIAIVSELTIRTTVLTRAPELVEVRAGLLERRRVGPAVHQVGHEQAAEEHDFGDQEHPHPEGRGLELLRHVVEVVLQLRMMRVRRDAPCAALACTGGL